MFYSTRDQSLRLSASEAILKGLSDDGGLFLPCKIPSFPLDEATLKLDYRALAKRILSFYLDDFTQEEISSCVERAYCKANFQEKIIGVTTFGGLSFLELSHGPTLTFKDMALSILPLLMEVALKKHPQQGKTMVITATSGDTGSAALNGFKNAKDIEIKVLYPEGGISKMQEKQMLYFTSSHSRAYALKDANFDDCQRLIKKCLKEKHPGFELTSANSINIGRLLPQVVYYYASYITLVNQGTLALGEKMDVVVPTGNFGNIFACYLAKQMGLPVAKLVVASNQNDVLTEFFKTGVYDRAKRSLIKTNSPSMDILISSNFERLLSLIIKDEDLLKKKMEQLASDGKFFLEKDYRASLADFAAFSLNQQETLLAMKECYEAHHYLIDPHTSVAFGASQRFTSPRHVLVVSTASPFKFPETVLEAFGLPKEQDEVAALNKMSQVFALPLPPQLQAILHHPFVAKSVKESEVESLFFASKAVQVQVPSSSANLGVYFDVAGIALRMHNTYAFSPNKEDELVGFSPEYQQNNLVLHAYQAYFAALGIAPLPVRIEAKKEEIPPERGLGSSSACIIAGLLGANALNNEALPQDKLLEIAIALEGHPDNVAPCLLGGLVSNLKKQDGSYLSKSFPISSSLHFLAFIPPSKTKTSAMREVLPDSYSREDLVYNLSRASLLLSALEAGDLPLIKECLDDRVATPSRLMLLPFGEALFKKAKDAGLPVTISGSGSTILVIAKDDTFLAEVRNDPEFALLRCLDLLVDGGACYVK